MRRLSGSSPVAERWLKVGAQGAAGGAACVRSDTPSLHGPEPRLFAALTRTEYMFPGFRPSTCHSPHISIGAKKNAWRTSRSHWHPAAVTGSDLLQAAVQMVELTVNCKARAEGQCLTFTLHAHAGASMLWAVMGMLTCRPCMHGRTLNRLSWS